MCMDRTGRMTEAEKRRRRRFDLKNWGNRDLGGWGADAEVHRRLYQGLDRNYGERD